MIHIWSVDTRAAQGRLTCRAALENFSSSHVGSLTMKKSRSLFCEGEANHRYGQRQQELRLHALKTQSPQRPQLSAMLAS